MSGVIVAVCTSPKGGVPKYPRPEGARVAEFGLEGDFHNREMRRSFSKPGTMKPNTDRHITIVASEVLETLNRDLNINLVPGSLGENITVQGMGYLSDVPDDATIYIRRNGIIVALRVSEQNNPCKNLAPYHPLLVKQVYGRRGLLCAVHHGVGTYIRPGDSVGWSLW